MGGQTNIKDDLRYFLTAVYFYGGTYIFNVIRFWFELPVKHLNDRMVSWNSGKYIVSITCVSAILAFTYGISRVSMWLLFLTLLVIFAVPSIYMFVSYIADTMEDDY